MRNKKIKNVNPIISTRCWLLEMNFCEIFPVSIVSKISWWMWHEPTEFNRFWVIVLRSQVFRRLKELKLLVAQQEEAGLTNKMCKRVCTSSKKNHTSCVISLKNFRTSAIEFYLCLDQNIDSCTFKLFISISGYCSHSGVTFPDSKIDFIFWYLEILSPVKRLSIPLIAESIT